jgi:hypothetical protein
MLIYQILQRGVKIQIHIVVFRKALTALVSFFFFNHCDKCKRNKLKERKHYFRSWFQTVVG